MTWWNRLSVRFTFFILFLALAPLACFGIATINDVLEVRMRSVAQLHSSVADSVAEHIENLLGKTSNDIQFFLNSIELESLNTEDQEWQLQMLLKGYPLLTTVALVQIDGKVTLKIGRDTLYNKQDIAQHANHPDFSKTTDIKPVISEIQKNHNNHLVVEIYIPLIHPVERTVSSLIVAEIAIEKLLNFTTELRVGETGYVYVVNTDGKFLAYPDHSAVLAGEDGLANPLVQSFISGKNTLEPNGIYFNRKNQEVLTNVRAVRKPQLLVVVSQSTAEALSAVKSIKTRQTILLSSVLLLAFFLSLYFMRKTIKPLHKLQDGARLIGAGNLSHRIPETSSDELGSVARSFNVMAMELEQVRTEAEFQHKLKEGVVELDALLRGDQSLEQICSHIVTFSANFLQQQAGVIYTNNGEGTFNYTAGYAFQPGPGHTNSFNMGETLSGQSAAEKKILLVSDIPSESLTIQSSLGPMMPKVITVVPFVYNDQVEAVMELGSINIPTEIHKLFLSEIVDAAAIIIASAKSRSALNEALAQTREQTRKLHQQQEELQASNEEMEEQTQLLMASEGKLKEQQEELQAANEELEERNIAFGILHKELEKKAENLETVSKYKSEFLANMSHELRTPLNSLLLLSRMLADNSKGNLFKEQVESAEIIYNSGNDLLYLINEILDLAKIEAGKMELRIGEVDLQELLQSLTRSFNGSAKEKVLSFKTITSNGAPQFIVSDRQRIEQVLKNFLANAFKFTTVGEITLEIFKPDNTVELSRPGLTINNTIGIAVHDTGIGIPAQQQKTIFEAFRQLTGGSSREHGGTGLGLSISMELANLLGGEIQVQSKENSGSTFTLFLPLTLQPADSKSSNQLAAESKPPKKVAEKKVSKGLDNNELLVNLLTDDRDDISTASNTILIIEDDVSFAQTLLRFCRAKGYSCLVAVSGEEGLSLAQRYIPKGIILDINLPGIDGWTVLENLKENHSTRHIPVHFMSANAISSKAFTTGAVGFLNKPVSKEELETALESLTSISNKIQKDLLLVADDEEKCSRTIKLIGDSDVSIMQVSSKEEAITTLRQKMYDCMILDLGLKDLSAFALLKEIVEDELIQAPPVVVCTSKQLNHQEETDLKKYSESICIKDVCSEERLLDETSLFLHRMVEVMPENKRKMLANLHDTDQLLAGKNILIADDDMRNVFALSKLLTDRGMHTIKAENGTKVLEILEQGSDIDLILMDIMMPKMDGYETMRRIRQNSRFSSLPIIALTAKAMQQDKKDCISAGANDYLAKPVDIQRLLSMLRIWLYR